MADSRMTALLEAVWQVLDDMGATGHSCCPAAKAQLRVAFEPFRDAELEVDYPLGVAVALLDQLERTRG